MFTQRLRVAVDDKHPRGEFLELVLRRRHAQVGEVLDPARQQGLLLAGEALATFVRLSVGDAAVEPVLQRRARDMPSLGCGPLRRALVDFAHGLLEVVFGVLGHGG